MKLSWRRELYNFKYFTSIVWKSSPGYVVAIFMESLLSAAIPFVAIVFPKYIIDEMMGAKRIRVLALYVAAAVLITLFLSITSGALKRYVKAITGDILVGFEYVIGKHNMEIAYENLEDPKYMEQNDRAMMPIRERMTHLVMIWYLPDMIRHFIIAVGSVGILLSFDIITLIVILIPTFFVAWFNKRYQKKDMEIHQEAVCMDRFFMYYYSLLKDFGQGKDIRLFDFHTLIMKRNNECDNMILDFKGRSSKLKCDFERVSGVLGTFRTAFAYGFIGVKALVSNIGIGNFTMYTGAAAAFSNATTGFLNGFISLRQDCRYLEDFVKLQEMTVEKEEGGLKDLDLDKINLEFRHVSFRYPGTDCDVLKDVSFELKPGESLSIVGKNGAGKTTIIKLLSRLFKPESGQILINGIDINQIDMDVYRKLVSVVFQDFKIFEFSVEENVAAGTSVSEEKLNDALRDSGIMEKIQSLSRGSKTYVGKQFDQNGTEFSGGELQKLAIARAIYKNSPVIVLDEPTAALDPYAEEEVYKHFHRLTRGRTAVYISHRLSSCKFCDSIVFLNDGKIAEHGSHEELMIHNGRYAEMFLLQASQFSN